MPSTIFGTCSPPRRPYTRAPYSQLRSTSQPWPQSTECKKKAVGTMARRRRPNYTGGRWRWRRRGIMRTQLTVKIRLHDLSPRHFQNISTISTHFHATIISRTALPLLSRPWRTSHLPSPSTSSPPGNSKHQKGRLAGRLATPTPTLHTRLVSSLLTPKPPSTASKTSP